MNRALVDQVVAAVLYEGYILYPYRPSLKNRQRWTFGGLCPRAYSEAHAGADPWALQTECLIEGDRDASVEVSVGFLHLVQRRVGRLVHPLADLPDHPDWPFLPVDALRVGDTLYQSWQEAVERRLEVAPLALGQLQAQAHRERFAFPASQTRDPLRDGDGQLHGVILRVQEAIEGEVEIAAEPLAEGLFRLRVQVFNRTALDAPWQVSRDEALLRGLVSTHAMLGVDRGQFCSLTDPPDAWREAASACRNLGAWPVLVGKPPERQMMLAAPIILYDYPQIARESPADFFDSTEIDELLTLRILTLTDEEKQAMQAVDPRAADLLQRAETMAREELLGLHGAVRDLQPMHKER
jgi:hydrogenase maturation protease